MLAEALRKCDLCKAQRKKLSADWLSTVVAANVFQPVAKRAQKQWNDYATVKEKHTYCSLNPSVSFYLSRSFQLLFFLNDKT